jgi:shikimate dehydrogenase
VAEIVFPFEPSCAGGAGCATVDGGTMAIGQAIGAFRLFTGLDADAVRVAAHFERLIGAAT